MKPADMRVLCKFRGMLVIAEVSMRSDGTAGKCPECGSAEFYEHAGWLECDCGFAYLMSDIKRLMSTNFFKSDKKICAWPKSD